MPSVAEIAYALWEARGRPHGDDWSDWFEAEAQLRAQAARRGSTPTRASATSRSPPPLFDTNLSGEAGYEACRDHGTKADVRRALETAWARVWHLCPEGPEQFLRQLRQDFDARAWELFLMAVLLDAGLHLEPAPGKGPDIRIRLDSGRICWIEAITPTPGTGNNAVPQRPPGPWAGSLYKEEGLLLRYRSALEAKLRKFEEYRASGIVAPDDACVIAVSQGGILDSDMHDSDLPAMARAVFPIGETVLRVVPYSGQPATVETPQRLHLLNANGQPVSTTFFFEPRTQFLAGVLFARHPIWNLTWVASESLNFIHRPQPTVSLARGTLPARCEMWMENDGTLLHRGTCARYGIYSQ